MIVKFSTVETKMEVYKSKRNLKGTGITIVENLIKSRLDLLREVKKTHPEVWTYQGEIFIIKNDRRKKIQHIKDVE